MSRFRGPTVLVIRYCIGCFQVLEEREVRSTKMYERRFPDGTVLIHEPGPCCFGDE